MSREEINGKFVAGWEEFHRTISFKMKWGETDTHLIFARISHDDTLELDYWTHDVIAEAVGYADAALNSGDIGDVDEPFEDYYEALLEALEEIAA